MQNQPLSHAKFAGIIISVVFSFGAFASQTFDEDTGWTISAPSLNEKDVCSAQKNINGIEVSIQSILNGGSNQTLLTLSKRKTQVAAGDLALMLDNKTLNLGSANYKLADKKISLLIPENVATLKDVGLTQTLLIDLKPHISINLDSPNYPMYLLSECNSDLDPNRFAHGSEAILLSLFPQAIFSQSQNELVQQPTEPKKSGIELNKLPDTFIDFVRAFTITDDDSLKFLGLAEAREKYTDWADAGWTGDEDFIMGIGTRVTKTAKTIFEIWNENRREHCESNEGTFFSIDAGQRSSGEFSGHVTYMLCENAEKFHYLTLIVVKDAEPPSYGLIEARSVHETNLRSVRNWIIEQKK